MAELGIATRARHEAAHAVLSVRLGLPLDFVDLRTRTVESTEGRAVPNGVDVKSGGYTTLVPGTAEKWEAEARQGDATARTRLESLAMQTMGGIVAAGRYDDLSCRDDLYQLVGIAGALGIGSRLKDPVVEAWIKGIEQRAKEVLYQDDGAAWDRVRVALERKRWLNGEEVEKLVAESDEGRA